MPYRVITLRSPSLLPKALTKVGVALEQSTIKALQKTARYGQTAVIRMMSKTVPKPEASYTYRNAWTVEKTKKGAILGNSALAAYFVEVGRRPGRMPPFSNPTDGILPWVRLKRFKFDASGAILKKKKARKQRKRKSPAANKVSNQRKKAASSVGSRAGSGESPRPKAAPRTAPAKGKQRKLQERFAFLVARKVATKGTPGRYVLARTMPLIEKRAIKEQRKALKIVTRKAGP